MLVEILAFNVVGQTSQNINIRDQHDTQFRWGTTFHIAPADLSLRYPPLGALDPWLLREQPVMTPIRLRGCAG